MRASRSGLRTGPEPSRAARPSKRRSSLAPALPNQQREVERGPPPRSRAPVGIDERKVSFYPELVSDANRAWLARRFGEALSLVEDALTANPLNAELTYGYASLLAASGERVTALDALLQAFRFGFADADKVLADASWESLRQDREFERIIQRLDERARSDEAERLEEIRRGYLFLLTRLSDRLPVEIHISRCPSCVEYRIDQGHPDYDFSWETLEGFQSEVIAPLAMEQLRCEACGGYSVEIIGTVHGFVIEAQRSLHIIYWLDGGQVRTRFIYQQEHDGLLGELRTYFAPGRLRFDALKSSNDSLGMRLNNQIPEVVESAIRDLGIPNNHSAVDILSDLLNRLSSETDNLGLARNPWLIREILTSFTAIANPDALHPIFMCAIALLGHTGIDPSLAQTLCDTSISLGGPPILGDLLALLQENVQAATPEALYDLTAAILDLAESQGNRQTAEEARRLIEETRI